MRYEIEGLDELNSKLESLMQITDAIEDVAAPQICEVMRARATRELRASQAVDTGRLVGSIESKSSEFVDCKGETVVEMGIATSVPYAQFIEYGTGPRGDPAVPHTTKMAWVYRGEDGELHVAKSQEARPFMRPALYDNREVFGEIIAGTINDVFEGSE